MPFSKHKRGPLTDISRWRTRLFRDRSTPVPAIPAVGIALEPQCVTPPMDATPIHEGEFYETNIAGIGSGKGLSAMCMQSVYIPRASPLTLSRTVTPRLGTDQRRNISLPEVDEVSNICTKRASHRTAKIAS
jgi:hypothetical protein